VWISIETVSGSPETSPAVASFPLGHAAFDALSRLSGHNFWHSIENAVFEGHAELSLNTTNQGG
jgi:hypothetical protein